MSAVSLISFSNVKDNDLVNNAQKIVDKMTNNSNYTAPQPDLSTVQGAILAYSAALVKSKDGNKEDTANKNAMRLVVENTLSALGNYVNLTASSDLVKLESSGFPVSKIPQAVGILDAPTLNVQYGNNPGEIDVEIGVVANANEYLLLYSLSPAPANDAEWRSKLFSKTRGTITGLTSGIKYIFKVAATSSEANKIGLYNFSTPVEKLVP